ncbi:hypothetical protein BD410DRAFT_155755 [Rickenella mellea]|uniref:ARM repeat-containing protein n=1 Tax=Rickenella mellea TaxID=50990 RepID=A0A4Y7PKD0_9AGAM|nr:hypothetical protein BD410DRAFT_155755 [Rickenella mellea]
MRMDTNLKLFAISSLVPLLYSNDIDAISPALTALRAIDESNEAAETAVHKSTVPTLVKLLWLSDITMQINACVLLHKAVENSEAAKEVAINSGAVAALFRLLSSQSKMLQDVATEVLVSITNDWQGPGVTAAIRVVPVADRLELLHSDNSNVAIASCNSLAHNKWERRSEMTAARDQLRTLSTSDVLQVGEAAKKALWAIETELEAINPSNVTPSSITIGFTGNASSDGTAVQSNMNLKLWATNTREYAPGALWISRRADEVLYTDGIVRLETDIDGKKYNCYRVRNSAGRMGLITTWFTISESALNKKVTASITWRDETPGTRWLSIQKGEILFTDGVTQETVENNGGLLKFMGSTAVIICYP